MATDTALAPTAFEKFQPFIVKYADEFAKALPNKMSRERFMRMALTYVRANPFVLQSDPLSIASAIMVAAQLGLAPDGALGHAYLVPYWSNKEKTYICQLIIGYKGYIDLIHRAKEVAIEAHVVYEGDTFDYELGTTPFIKHKPCGKSPVMTAVYAVCRYANGLAQFEVMTAAEIQPIKDKQIAIAKGRPTPWITNEGEMWRKTAVRRLSKYIPQSPEIAKANQAEDEPETIQTMAMAEDVVVTGPDKTAGTEALKAEIKGEKEPWDAPFGGKK